MNKINLIYILGYGHSGSTLLNLILGTSNNAISLGELMSIKYCLKKQIPKKYFANPRFKCSCGKDFDNCELWQNTTNKINSEKLYHPNLGIIKKTIIFLSMFTNKNRTEQEKLLHQILNNSYKVKGNNVKFLIDSSKDPINLAYLLSIKDINLKVIFLTRDLNAVINSCQKINQPWLKTIFFWIITNILSKLVLLNVKKENKVNLSYDNFVKRLPFYINQLNSKLNLKIDYKNLILNINNEIFHNFAGIILRIKPLTYISYDDSWKFVNTNWKKKYILFITRFFNNLWVYKRVFLMSQF